MVGIYVTALLPVIAPPMEHIRRELKTFHAFREWYIHDASYLIHHHGTYDKPRDLDGTKTTLQSLAGTELRFGLSKDGCKLAAPVLTVTIPGLTMHAQSLREKRFNRTTPSFPVKYLRACFDCHFAFFSMTDGD